MERVEAEKREGVEEREELLGNKRKKGGKERFQGERAGEGNAQGWHLPALVGSREQTHSHKGVCIFWPGRTQYLCSELRSVCTQWKVDS